jgi:site-specific recombinase XerD
MVGEIGSHEKEDGPERAFDLIEGFWPARKTQEAYKAGWDDFAKFCRSEGVESLPTSPETLVKFLRAREPICSNTALSQRLAVIRGLHARIKGQMPRVDPNRDRYTLDDPIITNTWKEIRDRKESEPVSKAAIRSKELEIILRKIPDTERGRQDRAVLCVGLAYALLRTEIVALDRDDLEIDDEGMQLRIHGSKSVTLTAARTGTETCPVTAMERWLEAGKISRGPVFMSSRGNRMEGRHVATILQEYGNEAGFDREILGAQSLRSGCILERIQAGDHYRDIMKFARIESPAIYVEYLDAKAAEPNTTSSEEKDIAEINSDQNLSETEKKTLIDARRGQGKFRDALRERWNDACAVTGCTVLAVLKASHIQPWKHSTNPERLNPANGLLLEANLDSLFDKHLISFKDDGEMLVAPNIDDDERQLLRLPGRLRKPLNSAEKRFLAKHRAEGGFSKPQSGPSSAGW